MTAHQEHSTNNTTFSDLGIETGLAEILESEGISSPFPIQTMAIPDILAGRDVCGRAKTGSGKTLAFGLPIIQNLLKARPRKPRAMVLVPTRELAHQITEVLRPLAQSKEFFLVAIYGGVPLQPQIDQLQKGAEIIIATPGRLIDLMDRREVYLDDVSMVAIDEADQMADMGFLPQVRRIMRQISTDHQTMLFSATLDGQVGTLIRAYMLNPVHHAVESEVTAIDTMEHRFLRVHYMDKPKVAAAIARSANRTLAFTRTKHGCERVAKELRAEGVKARAIHGDLHQSSREKALASFANGQLPVLVATNVAARGLHISNVDIVMHYDPPDDPKTYLHRSGRTARAGESGLVVTLVEWDQVNEVIGIQRRADLNVPIVKMFSNDDRLTDLTVWEPPEEFAPFSGAARRKPGSPRPRRRR